MERMCARFTLTSPILELERHFDVDFGDNLDPRYNIAPTQPVWGVTEEGGRHVRPFHWGLIPSWAKDRTIASRLINARCETAAELPTFREAFRRRRCLIPASGFFEWRHATLDDARADDHVREPVQGSLFDELPPAPVPAPKVPKQPFCFQVDGGAPFAFAGLWETWKTPEGENLESCCLLTTEPNDLVARLHIRMPVILDRADFDAWLDPDNRVPDRLQSLLRPFPAERMSAYPVSPRLNDPRNESPDLLRRAG